VARRGVEVGTGREIAGEWITGSVDGEDRAWLHDFLSPESSRRVLFYCTSPLLPPSSPDAFLSLLVRTFLFFYKKKVLQRNESEKGIGIYTMKG
jgi:hypothetical protein